MRATFSLQISQCAVLLITVLLSTGVVCGEPAGALPIRGLHCFAPRKADLERSEKFIRETLHKEGVNVLVLEFNYDFNYTSRPEFANKSAMGKNELKKLAAACRESNIKLV